MGNRRCFRDLKTIIRGLIRARRSYQSQTSETIHCLDWPQRLVVNNFFSVLIRKVVDFMELNDT
jgi:hypothetical protein